MSYWVTSAVLFCFTTIFLQFKGYSNYEIGIVFAVGNIIGFIAQPLIAGLVDKSQKRILLRCICITSILSALLMLAVCLLPSGSVTIMGAYALLIAGSTLLNPLCISLSFYVESWGSSVNFSRARAIGSFSFAVCNVVMGILVQRVSENAVPVSFIIFSALLGLITLLFIPGSVRIARLTQSMSRQISPSRVLLPYLQRKISVLCCSCSEPQRCSLPTA